LADADIAGGHEQMSKDRVLVVDDSLAMAQTVARYLASFAFVADCAGSGAEALERLTADPPDLVVTDLRMKDVDGLDVLDAVKRVNPLVPVVIMTGFGAIDSAIEAMRRGAYHYLTKPFEMEVMRLLVERACREKALRQENRLLRQAIQERFSARNLLGASAPMRKLRALLERVAGPSSPVLVSGETGTGKELVARAIHAEGPRADAPFVAVNCAALPESLLETELFGHAKGAFTGASQSRRGLVVEADGGTLFLDEIGDMPLALQAKLLRVLQSGEVRAVGSEAVRTVDVRCIAATHRDLKSLVQAGQFREDLFFRLDVLRVRVPPLRERREDIPALVEHFLERCARRIPQGTMAGFTPEAFDLLCKYAWPGNVRELENLIERLAVTTAARHVGVAEIREAVGWVRPGDPVSNLLREPMTLAELEDRYIEAVLEKADGNKARAAGLLGIDLSTLYRRQRRRAG
jgi:two-component system response regulator HydG